MQYYNLDNIFLYFIIFSFLGWLAETIYCYIIDKKFTYRGFLYGPICPIYGTGALIVIFILNPFNNNILLLFIFGLILTSVLEYVTSYVMEKLFHTKWWDYSNHKFNINGRVCLLNSTLFGLLSVLLTKFVEPLVASLVNIIPKIYQPELSGALFAIFTTDLILTVVHLLNLKKKFIDLKNIKVDLKKLGIYISSYKKEELENIKKLNKDSRIRNLIQKLENNIQDSYKFKRILNTYSNGKYKYDKKGLEDLLKRIKKEK